LYFFGSLAVIFLSEDTKRAKLNRSERTSQAAWRMLPQRRLARFSHMLLGSYLNSRFAIAGKRSWVRAKSSIVNACIQEAWDLI